MKNSPNRLRAVIEDAPQLGADEKRMSQIAQGAEGERVGYLVMDGDGAIAQVGKGVLVMPDVKRADALLIDEEPPLIDLRDLAHPGHGDAKEGADAVLDHHAGMDAGRQLRDHFKSKLGRGNAGEIAGV